ncbi:tyrosine-type recombinase/integrase [Streptomyces sp. NPDC057301]|uniref:tyrosine-type recombinase/integrase n=1 Tax=Streptomyces sp. NPDC057301 TaxID=3346093 RepID=UPI00362DEBE5
MSRGQYVDPRAARTTFQQYAERWIAGQTTDLNTRIGAETRLRLHAFPRIGARPLGSFRPVHIREFVRDLKNDSIGGTYARNIYANVRAVLSAAVDDGHLARNPCSAASVRPPAASTSRVVPWLPSQVRAVRDALPERYRDMVDVGSGCGLRQGEVIGLAEDTAQLDSDTLRVPTQIKLVRGVAVVAPPKGDKERDVPLPSSVASALRWHIKSHPPVAIKLPWIRPDGPLTERRLIFTNTGEGIVWRSNFNIKAVSEPAGPWMVSSAWPRSPDGPGTAHRAQDGPLLATTSLVGGFFVPGAHQFSGCRHNSPRVADPLE